MTHNHIRPLGNRILVRRAKAKSTKGGILLPDAAQEKPKMGEVVAMGPGKQDEDGKLQPMQVQVGNTVLFGAYAGVEVKTKETEAEDLIMAEDEVLGVLVRCQT